MVRKSVKISLFAAALGTAGVFALGNSGFWKPSQIVKAMPGSGGEYEEEEGEKESEANIAGAVEYLARRKGSLSTGKVDMNAFYQVQRDLSARPRSKSMGSWLNWAEMGPDNVGGRCRMVVIDRNNPKILYAGGVSGGMWKSTDGGTSWKRAGNTEVENINVSSLTQTANGDLYYGTGEEGFAGGNGDGNSGFQGRGVYKSTDGGATWAILKATDPGSNNFASVWSNVHSLNADPKDGNRLYAGNDGGFYLSTNGGDTWNKVTTISGSRSIKSIVVSPGGDTVYCAAASGNPGTGYALYRSTDRGETFTQVGKTDIPGAASSYVIAMAPSNPNTVFVSVADVGTRYGQFQGMYKTTDGGEHWNKIGAGDAFFNPLASQGYYDHAIAVDPTDENRVIFGGLNLWEGRQVGTQYQFTQLTNWSTEFFINNARNPAYVHADQHALVFERGTKNPALYICSDGGISKSTDITYAKTPSFFNADYGFSTVQFYGIGVSHTDENEVIGGSQDNGVIRVDKGGITLMNGTDIKSGDGGYSEISMINPSLYFGEYVYGDIARSFTRGSKNSWTKFFDNRIPAMGQTENNYEFIAKFTLWESLNDPTSIDTVIFRDLEKSHTAGETVSVRSRSAVNMQVKLTADLPAGQALNVQDVVQSKFFVATTGKGVWMTREAVIPSVTPTFYKIAAVPGFVANDFAVTADGNTVYAAGWQGVNGVIYRIDGLNGKDYSQMTTPESIGITSTRVLQVSGFAFTGIDVDQNDPNHVLAVVGGYGGSEKVYRSYNAMDAAPTFTGITGSLPRFPIYDALISLKEKNEYILGTEFGIWGSKNNGATWTEENGGMERVPVFELKQRKFSTKPWAGPVVYAATHGRGVFRTSTLATSIKDNNNTAADKLVVSIYPNPAIDFATVSVNLPENANVNISVFSMQGKEVATYRHANQLKGERSFQVETAGLKAGTYFVRVNAGSMEHTSKILVMTK